MQLVHGGDWAGYRAEFGRDPLDFSANVSPLGLPEGWPGPSRRHCPRRTATPTPCAGNCGQAALHEACRRSRYSAAMGSRPYLPAGLGKKAQPGAGHRPHLCGVCHCIGKHRLHGGTLLFAGAGGLCGHGCVLCGHPSGGGRCIPLPAQQPHRPADGPAAGGADPPPLRGVRHPAGGGRMLPRFPARPCPAHGKRSGWGREIWSS